MSFLYPAFLIGALAAALPIVLHLMRRDVAPEVPFTAVRFLRRTPVDRSRRRRLRDILLLAARVAALVLLALAFARPYASSASGGGLRVVAVDRSFSMGAPGRFERALTEARAAVDAGSGERIAVVTFDTRADVVAEPGTREDARAALQRLAAGFGATSYAALAERIEDLAEGGPGTLVVVTDLQQGGSQADRPVALPAGWRVEVRDVGPLEGNLAITSLSPDRDRLVATLRNDWRSARQGRIRIAHAGAEIAAMPFDVPADSVTDVSVTAAIPATGALAVSIDDPGGLPADDNRFQMLGDAAHARALIVTAAGAGPQAGYYISRALDAPAEDGGYAVDVRPASALESFGREKLAGYSVIVLTSSRGMDRRGREALAEHTRAGGGLVIAAAGDQEGSLLSSAFGWQPPLAPAELRERPLTFAATDPRHPIFRPFGPLLANLGQVRFDRAWRVADAGWTVTGRFDDGNPALLERMEGQGRVILFASDLDRRWNDFPVHPSFVPFAIETARYAAGARTAPVDFTVGAAPAGVEARPGIHTTGPEKREVAVNVPVAESDPARLDADEFARLFTPAAAGAGQATGLQARQIEAGQSYWRYGLILMLLVLVGESVVGRVRTAG